MYFSTFAKLYDLYSSLYFNELSLLLLIEMLVSLRKKVNRKSDTSIAFFSNVALFQLYYINF